MTRNMFSLPALAFALALGGLAAPAHAQDAAAIVAAIENRSEGKTAVTAMTMTLEDKQGNRRKRELQSYRKDYGDRMAMTLYFKVPDEVAGSAFLSVNYSGGKESDAWLFLPSVNKTRRVAQSSQADSFMGSDFSYSDIIGSDVNDWDYAIESQSDPVDGADCWVVISSPKAGAKSRVLAETGYTARRIWVRKDSYFIVRGEFTLKSGAVKLMSAQSLRKISGIWTAGSIKMVTTKGGKVITRSTITFSDVAYNNSLSDGLFTPDALVKGVN